MKRFYDVVKCADGVVFLSHYPKFNDAPPTVAFDLSSDLEIVDRIRPVTEGGIGVQMRGYGKDGEFTPILIRVWPAGGREWKGAKHARTPRLIDGAHRIEAAKRLGLKTIMALLVECSDDEAKAMEIAANIFRVELTPAEKGRQMIEWCRLKGLPAPSASDSVTAGITEVAGRGSDDHRSDGERADDMADEAAKLESPFQFPEPPADPDSEQLQGPTSHSQPVDAPSLHPRGGRGKKGSVAQVAEAFGVSKPTVRSHIAAAQAEAATKKGDTATKTPARARITRTERQARADAAAGLVVERIAVSDRTVLADPLEKVTDAKPAVLFVRSLLAQTGNPLGNARGQTGVDHIPAFGLLRSSARRRYLLPRDAAQRGGPGCDRFGNESE